MLYAGGPRGGNLEHQPSGLIWDLDNWIYMAMNDYRLRLQGTNVIQEPTPPTAASGASAQDDYGKLWLVNAGGEPGPCNFQQPIIYGAFNMQGSVRARLHGSLAAGRPGRRARRPGAFPPEDKTLNHFTAACGQEIFRGDRLPADLRGDLLFAEPVGRLIRRTEDRGERWRHLSAQSPTRNREFIRSTDPQFPPRQHDHRARRHSLYRRHVSRHHPGGQLGRRKAPICASSRSAISTGEELRPRPHLAAGATRISSPARSRTCSTKRPAQLVAAPGAPQRLVARHRARSSWSCAATNRSCPRSIQMARANTNHLARIHALWTLEGLDALDAAFTSREAQGPHPQVRIAAIRASETLYKKGDKSLVEEIQALAKDPDPNVVIQVMMTANLLKWPDTEKLVRAAITDQSGAVV